MIFRVGVFLFIVFNVFLTTAQAQEIEANINVSLEQIDQENRIYVTSMKSDLERYINNQRFTNIEWEGSRIPVDISIYLTGGYQGRFSARMFIASKRYLYGQEGGASITLRLVDEKWSFDYAMGASHSYNPRRFDKFISLLDYYLLLIIGFDMDTYGELDGTPIYEMSKEICRLGASYGASGYSTYSQPGEFTRYSLISELTDLRYEPLRILFFEYYVDGLDMIAENREEALIRLREVIDDIADFKKNKMVGPSVLLQAFFDAKAGELAASFKDYPDKTIYKTLMYLDPGNTMIYEEFGGF